jgi:hypothetical protein
MDEPRLATKFSADIGSIEWSDKPASETGLGVICAAAKLADLKTAVPNIRRLGGPKNVALLNEITLPSICDVADLPEYSEPRAADTDLEAVMIPTGKVDVALAILKAAGIL